MTILVTYLYFCLHAGPKYMKDRKPFDLKNTLIVYNVIQVVLSIYLVYEVSVHSAWIGDNSCEKCSVSVFRVSVFSGF